MVYEILCSCCSSEGKDRKRILQTTIALKPSIAEKDNKQIGFLSETGDAGDDHAGPTKKHKKRGSKQRVAESDHVELENCTIEADVEEATGRRKSGSRTGSKDSKSGNKDGADAKKRAEIWAEKVCTAAKRADLEGLAIALGRGGDINTADAEGFYPGMYLLRPPNENVIQSLEWLLEKKADLEKQDPSGRTVLHQLISRSQHAEVAWLVDRASWICEVKDNQGNTPFHVAVKMNSLQIAQNLLGQLGSHILKETDAQGLSPFQLACKHGALDVLQWLLRKQKGRPPLDQRATDEENMRGTVLHLAVRNQHPHVAKYLARLQANLKIKDSNGQTAQQIALESAQDDLAQWLSFWAEGKDWPLTQDLTDMMQACLSNHPAKVRELMETCQEYFGVGDSEGRTVAMLGIMKPSLPTEVINDMMKLCNLLRKNEEDFFLDKDNLGRSVLGYACIYGNIEVAELLIKSKADVLAESDDAGNNAWHLAATKQLNGKRMCDFLMKASGGKPLANEANNLGQTPIFPACKRPLKEIEVRYQFGTDMFVAKDISWALDPPEPPPEQRRSPVVEQLIKVPKKDDSPAKNMGLKKYARLLRLSIVNETSHTVWNIKIHDDVEAILKKAASYRKDIVLTFEDESTDPKQLKNSLELVQFMIQSKADVCQRSHEGQTPLMVAAVNGRIDLCDELVKAKADVNVRDGNDKALFYHFMSHAKLGKEEYDAMAAWIHRKTGVGNAPQQPANKWRGVGAMLRFQARPLATLGAVVTKTDSTATAKAKAKGKNKRKTSKSSADEESSENDKGLGFRSLNSQGRQVD